MDVQTEQRIRERAYHIWIDAGKAPGLDRDHWYAAVRDVTAKEGPKTVKAVKTVAPKTTSAKRPASTAAAVKAVGAKSANNVAKTAKTKSVAVKTPKGGVASAGLC